MTRTSGGGGSNRGGAQANTKKEYRTAARLTAGGSRRAGEYLENASKVRRDTTRNANSKLVAKAGAAARKRRGK